MKSSEEELFVKSLIADFYKAKYLFLEGRLGTRLKLF